MSDYNIQPIAQKIIRDIVWKIRRNEYLPGQQFPSIEDLAKQYNVGRSTIREAIKYLQSNGLVHSIHGKGTFLIEFTPSENGVLFLENIVELRRMTEINTIRKAVYARDEQDIARLGELIEQMDRAIANTSLFMEIDRQFHTAIAVASKNIFLPGILRNIDGLFSGVQDAVIYLPGSKEASMLEHKRMLQAIAESNEEMAVETMEAHLDRVIKLIHEGNNAESSKNT